MYCLSYIQMVYPSNEDSMYKIHKKKKKTPRPVH